MKIQLEEFINDNLISGFTPYYIYDIYEESHLVGKIVFRLGTDQQHYYDGHIGYSIYEEFQGHHYAYQACLLLKEIIREAGYDHVMVTCDPSNIASRKTIERLQAQFIEELPIPSTLRKVFTNDEKIKRIYRWEINV